MDPLRQSVDLSRLVIAKEFFASPAKVPTNRGSQNPNTARLVADISNASSDQHLSTSPTEARTKESGWPLRLSSLANRLSPETGSSSITPSGGLSPVGATPSLEAFLQESPALFSEPRALNERDRGPRDLGAQQGKKGSVNRTLRFGAPADVTRVDEVAYDQLEDPQRRQRVAEGGTRLAGEARPPLTLRVDVPTRQLNSQESGIKSGGQTGSLKAGMLPSPPKRTPPQLRRSQSQRPFAVAAAGCDTGSVNVGPRNLRTPVGWVGFDDAGAENDENQDLVWAAGVRNTHASQLRTHVQTGENYTQGSKSPTSSFWGGQRELAKRSPMKSKSILKSPLREKDARGSGKEVRWSENEVVGRPVLASREPFQQISENAATNATADTGGRDRRILLQGASTSVRSPGSSVIRRPSPLGKGFSLSPQPATVGTASKGMTAEPSGAKPVGCAGSQDVRPDCPKQPQDLDEERLTAAVGKASLGHVAQEPIIVRRTAHISSGDATGPETPGPPFEDSDFRAGLAALAKLKLKAEQGPGEETSAPGAFDRSVSGSLVENILPGSKTGVVNDERDDHLRANEGESGRVNRAAGKSKWGFGPFGRKTTEFDVPSVKEEGEKPITRPGDESDRSFANQIPGNVEPATDSSVESRKKTARERTRRKGGSQREGADDLGLTAGKRRTVENTSPKSGEASAAGENVFAPEQTQAERNFLTEDASDVGSNVSRPGDVTEKRLKKGLLRKAFHLKRSKRGRTTQEEKAGAANKDPARGELREQEPVADSSSHVEKQARARDTPVKIILEGVKIVVRPKDAESDVIEQLQGSEPAEPTNACHVDTTTDQKLERLAAALERAQQTPRSNRVHARSPATLSAEMLLPTSPKASPGARISLSGYKASPVGSAERLEEVRARMEERSRALADRRKLPKAARRLQMEWDVAEKETPEPVPMVGAESDSKEAEGILFAVENGADSVTSDLCIQAVDLPTSADPTGLEDAELEPPTARMLESESALIGVVGEKGHEKLVGTPRSVAPVEEPIPDDAAYETDGTQVGCQTPPDETQTRESLSPRPLVAFAIGAEVERHTAAQEAAADSDVRALASSVLTSAHPEAGNPLTSAYSEAGAPKTSATSSAGVSLKLANLSAGDFLPAEPRLISPLGAFTGAAAFFRSASARSTFTVARSAAVAVQKRPVAVTGNQLSPVTATVEFTVGQPSLAVEGLPREEANIRAECSKPEPIPSHDMSSQLESRSDKPRQIEGDHPPANAAVQLPAGLSMVGSSGEGNRGEESPEERPRGAAAFFSQTSGPVAAGKNTAVVSETGAPQFEARPTGPPVVPSARRKSHEEKLVPSVERIPKAEGGSVTPAEQSHPDHTIPSASENLVKATTATGKPDSPPERMPNAAAFFGRRVGRPVALSVASPLQELKGFANRANGTGVQSEKRGTETAVREDKDLEVKSVPEQRLRKVISEATEVKATVKLRTSPAVPFPVSTKSGPEPAPGKDVVSVLEQTQSVREPSADVTFVAIAGQSSMGEELAHASQHTVLRMRSEGEGEALISRPVSKSEVPRVEDASANVSRERVGDVRLEKRRYGHKSGTESGLAGPDGISSAAGTNSFRAGQSSQGAGPAPPQFDALMRENERLKAQVVLLQEEKHRIAKQMEAGTLKANGNAAFGKAKYEDAKRFYNQALELRVNDNQFNGVIYTNRAAANLALGAAMDALADCAAALRIDPKCAGAVLRKVDACLAIGDWETALDDLSALEKDEIGTTTVAVQRKLHDLKAKMWRAPPQLDFYSILELPPRSNVTAIKNAYKRLALRHHPDRAGPHADLVFQYIARAYQVLSNPVDKKRYDAFLQRALK